MYFVLFQQGHNNLIKRDEGIYNVTLVFYLKKKQYFELSFYQRILKTIKH